MDSSEGNGSQKSFLLREEMKIALGDLRFQSSAEADISNKALEEVGFSDVPFVKNQVSDPVLNLHATSTSTVFSEEPLPNKSTNQDPHRGDDLKPNNYTLKKRYFNRHVKEKLAVSIGIFLAILLLVWNGLITWLMKTIYSYPYQTFGWKIILELLFMWITSISNECIYYTKEIIVNSIERCVRHEVFMNCPYEVQYSGALGIFSFLLAISALLAAVASLFFCSRKIRENCRFLGIYVIGNFLILWCWISLWLLLPFAMTFYSSFSKLESEMKETINEMSPPNFISLWWNQTQTYSQCCGMTNYEDWKINKNGTYPISCCNNIDRDCETFPKAEHVWLNGCYDEEYQRLQFFGFSFLALWVLKAVTEFSLFCVLSKVLGSYAMPDYRKLSASVKINGYKIEVYGTMDIHSVPNRHQIIIERRSNTDECDYIKTKQKNRRMLSVLGKHNEKLFGYVKIMALTDHSIEDVVISDFIGSKNRNNNCFLIEI